MLILLIERIATSAAEIVLAVVVVRATVQRLARRLDEAAGALGVSRDSFDEHIGPEPSWVLRGRCKLVPVVEREAWLAEWEERQARSATFRCAGSSCRQRVMRLDQEEATMPETTLVLVASAACRVCGETPPPDRFVRVRDETNLEREDA